MNGNVSQSRSQAAALSMLNPVHKEFLGRLFVPMASPENPLQRISDSWGSVDTSRGIETFPFIYARQITLDYLQERINILNGETGIGLTLDISRISEVKSEFDELKSFAEVERRRVLYTMVDAQLALCVRLAGIKEETVEQTKERLMKDSTK